MKLFSRRLPHLLGALAFAFFGAAGLVAQPAALPPPTEWLAPAGLPAAPGEAWTPPPASPEVVASPAVRIAEWNRSVRPDESFTLTGVGFLPAGADPAATRVWIWSGLAGGRLVSAPVRHLSTHVLVATVPAELPPDLFLAWVETSSGISAPVPLNRATASWLGPLGSIAAPGATKRLFGRDLAFADDDPLPRVWLESVANGAFTAATTVARDAYSLQFTVPADLATGSYLVRAHNGRGGAFGWCEPLTLTVATPFGRGADEITLTPAPAPQDDTARLQQAVDTLAALPAGGTLRLAAGQFTFRTALTLKSKVRVVGAGADATTLLGDGKLAFATSARDMALEDLTVRVSPGARLRVETTYGSGVSDADYNRDVLIRRVHFLVTPDDTSFIQLDLYGERLEIAACRFEGQLELAPIDCWVHDNQFLGSRPFPDTGNLSEGAIALTALRSTGGRHGRVVVENNQARTPDWPDIGGNRDYSLLSPEQKARRLHCGRFLHTRVWREGLPHLYIARNQIRDVGLLGNKGEVILLHNQAVPAYAQVAASDGLALTLRNDATIDGDSAFRVPFNGTPAAPFATPPTALAYANTLVGAATVLVAEGAGMGQHRLVTGVAGNTLTVDSPWRVPLDGTSRIQLLHAYTDAVVYRNKIEAFPKGWPEPDTDQFPASATSGVGLDGNALGCVAEGNLTVRAHSPAYMIANTFAPSYWNIIRDDRSVDMFHGGPVFSVSANNGSSTAALNVLGPVMLGNWIRGGASTRPVGVARSRGDRRPDAVNRLLLEGCGIEHARSEAPLFDADWCAALFRGNRVYRWSGAAPFATHTPRNLFSQIVPVTSSARIDLDNLAVTGELTAAETAPTLDLSDRPDASALVALTSHAALVSWVAPTAPFTGFRVERQQAGATTWTALADLPADRREHLDDTPLPGVAYAYRVRALGLADGPVSGPGALAALTLPAAADPSLMLHYAFEETAGSRVADRAEGRDATAYSAINIVDTAPGWTSQGRVGGALGFDASTRHAAAPNFNFGDLSALTVSLWVRPENLDDTSVRPLLYHKSVGNDATVALQFTNTRRLSVNVDTANNGFTSNAVFANDAWQHIALTFDGAKPAAERVRLYVNGVPDRVANESSAVITARAFALSLARSPNSGTSPFAGRLDELRLYRRALSTDEIAGLAFRRAPVPAPSPATRMLGDGRMALAWTPLTDAATVQVWRRVGAGAWELAAELPGHATSWLAPAAAVPASYRLRAVNAAGPSALAPGFDAWLLDLLPPALLGSGYAAPLADPDGDGASNLLEYALARDPLASEPPAPAAVALLPPPDTTALGAVSPDAGYAVARDPATGRLALTFRRARAELTYVVEACFDLAAPAGSPNGWQALATNPGAVGQLVTVADTLPATPGDTPPPRRFLRLRVEAP